MAQSAQPSNYKQGYSEHTVSTHLLRSAETDAAFLLPHIKPTDRILDVGCGPGTITTSLAKYASSGGVVGVDVSPEVLQKARKLAAAASVPLQGAGSVVFEHADVLEGLPFPDASFDVVYCSQLFGHLPLPDLPLRALAETRRVLKPGGVLATRDAADQHFYPRSLGLDRLWVQNLSRALMSRGGGKASSSSLLSPPPPPPPDADLTGTSMPALIRAAGYDSGRIRIGAGTTTFSGPEARRWLASRGAGQLRQGDAFRQSWLDAGISEEEIEETLTAVEKWADTEDAWYAALQCEMLAWK